MSRWDLTGLFWDDYVAPRVPVVKEKRQPPDPVWLAPDYLPHAAEAAAFRMPEMTDAEVMACAGKKLPWDTEYYPNYSLVGWQDPETGKVASFEQTYDETWGMCLWSAPLEKMAWIARNVVPIGFNDIDFDVPMLHCTLKGLDTYQLMDCVNLLITGENFDGMGMAAGDLYKRYGVQPFDVNHIDLIALTPGSDKPGAWARKGPSLKVCAGRLHTPRMADLPFRVGHPLSPQQIEVLRWYWYNDLENTKILWRSHSAAIELRELMSKEYDVDLRSKSDAQIAEAVIRAEISRMTGKKYIPRTPLVPWRSFMYRPPAYLQYASPTMQWVLECIRRQVFMVDDKGLVVEPDELSKLVVSIADGKYAMGIGGLHSQESRTKHVAGDTHEIMDSDVTGYYPNLIIQQGMYPPNIGPDFLKVFQRIVDRRVAAKDAGDKGTAETLKIVTNGTFGKTGEKFSVVYYPEMMIQVTVTGQLSIMLLIERMELAGISVISANTDGIITKCPLGLRETRDALMKQWEQDTGLRLEHKRYKAVYSRDVNSYVAVLDKPDPKEKGAYSLVKTVGAYRKTIDVYPLKWNPTCEICNEALIEFLATGRSVEETVRACTDIRKFIEARKVSGGSCKDGEYLGKSIRWYYSNDCPGEIINAKTGGRVPKSDNARPCLELPTGIPADLDYQYYIDRAIGLLADFEPKKTAAEKKALASIAA